jgi:hypothetical protein
MTVPLSMQDTGWDNVRYRPIRKQIILFTFKPPVEVFVEKIIVVFSPEYQVGFIRLESALYKILDDVGVPQSPTISEILCGKAILLCFFVGYV